MLEFDKPYTLPGGPKREATPFFLGVTWRNIKLAFMCGPDAKDSFRFVIAQWTPWTGLTRVDLPIHEIQWVHHV